MHTKGCSPSLPSFPFSNFWFLRLSGCAKEFCSSAEASEMYEVFGPQYPQPTKDTIMSVK